MMEEVNDLYKQIEPSEVLNYLESVEVLTSRNFSYFFRYFQYQLEKDNMTEDEKCLMAVYLIQMNIDLSSGKFHGCTGKKYKLIEYYNNNFNKCSNEMKEKIVEHINYTNKKSLEDKLAKEEAEVAEKYPEIYHELVEYRKANFYQKQKIRKHG